MERRARPHAGIGRWSAALALSLLAGVGVLSAVVPAAPSPSPSLPGAAPSPPLTLVEALRRAQVEIGLATTAGTALDAAVADADFAELASDVAEVEARRQRATMDLARAESKLLTASGLQSTAYAVEAGELAASARNERERLLEELGQARSRRLGELDRQVAILAPEARQVLLDTASVEGVEVAFQRSEQERLLGEIERERGLVGRRRVLEDLRRSTRFLRLVAERQPGQQATRPPAVTAQPSPVVGVAAAPRATALPVATAVVTELRDGAWRRPLEAAVQAFLEGRYQAAADTLGGIGEVGGRPGAVIQLLVAAARFQQAARSGDDSGLDKATEAARAAALLDPSLTPDPVVFSPRFTSFFLAAR